MQKILLQRNSDEYLRSLRILLRDTIRNSRQDFDLHRFTSELISDNLIRMYIFNSSASQNYLATCNLFTLAGGLVDFSQTQSKEKYVNFVCDLITVCILVAITPQIKEAYLRRQHETKEILIKYYILMSQIQCDTVSWLATTVRQYEINSNELVRCLFKVLFMVERPEQCYTIDNWPSEQEKATLFRVVSEIPVLSDTLHQVLHLTKFLPENMYMLMLCVEENLLKTAALVHMKDIYSVRINSPDLYIQSLFNICLYKYQVPPKLVVTVLYWKAWQILLILSAVDPKNFGRTTWEQYPTLRVLMEMIMTEDFSYPPQSSITEELTLERLRAIESQAIQIEKQEILEFENMFEKRTAPQNQTITLRNETNSKLIGQVKDFF
jgi:integrator complex subunit 1